MLINNISSKFSNNSFKKSDEIKKRNSEKVFLFRENTKENNKLIDTLFGIALTVSTLLIPNYKKENYNQITLTYLACLIPGLIINSFSNSKIYNEEYKEKVQNTPLKKEKPWKYILASALPLFIPVINYLTGEKITSKDKKYSTIGLAIAVISSTLTYLFKNYNIKTCEDEVNKLKQNAKAA